MWKPIGLWLKLLLKRFAGKQASGSTLHYFNTKTPFNGLCLSLPCDHLIDPTLFASIIGYKTDVIFRQEENRTLNQVCSLYSAAGRVRCVLSILHFGGGRKVLKERLEICFFFPPFHLEATTMAPCLVPSPECPEAQWITAEQHRGQAKEKEVSAVASYFTPSFP